MTTSDKSTEKTILEAAKRVFLLKGSDGARMQEIADEAGINKALLHYYFRSKEKLFDAIFQDAFQQFIPKVAEIMTTDKPLFEKLEFFIDTYLAMLSNNPHVPGFVLHEINRNPEKIVNLFKISGIKPEYLGMAIAKEAEAGNIRPIDPIHLIINIIAMCLFPHVGRPIIQGFLFSNNSDAYQKFLSERNVEIKSFVINSIRIKK
jgi:TetR/AcrR family transcriptional regulator